MKCSNCGNENANDANFCTNCNNPFTQPNTQEPSYPVSAPVAPAAPAYTPPPVSPPPVQSPQYPQQNQAPQAPVRTGVPYTYQQPYYVYQPKEKQPFTITDVYIIIGFVLSILGVFAYAFILLPAGIAFSIVGFVNRTNVRTLGLSIAGIVVGVVACLIKIGMILHEHGLIPDWLSAGIFN